MAQQTAQTTSRDANATIYYWALQPAESQYTGYLLNGISTWNDYAQAPDTGPAVDTFNGSDKDDRLFGSIGDDTIDGGTDDDWVIGGDGDDSLSGSDGNDTLYGDYVNTHVVTVGSNGALLWTVPSVSDDSLVGDDVLDGGDGADALIAGPGNDELHGGPRGDGFTDVLTGGDGADAFYLTYTQGTGGGGTGGTGFWSALLDEYAPGLGAKGAKAAVTKLAAFAAKDFFETSIGSTLLGGITTEVGSLATKGIELLLGMDKSAPPQPTGADVMVITDFDPREDVILLPLPSSSDPAKSLSAVPANFGSTNSNGAANGQSGWGVRFDLQSDESETTYAELLLSPDFLAEFGLDANSTGVEAFITDLFSNVIEIDDSGDPINGGLVNPTLQYRFPTSPSAYSDGVLPAVVDTPLALQAPSGTYTKIYGAFGPQIVVAAATGTATTYIGGTNMGDIIFPGANGFTPEDWDNPNVIAQPTTPTNTMGFDGDDILHGAAGQDEIDGGDGDDFIYGWNAAAAPAVDQLSGGGGDDTLFAAKPIGGRAAASFFGADGNDTASFYYSRYGVTANLATGVGSNTGDAGTGAYAFNDVESLVGTDYDDTLTGDDDDNALQGHMGDDVIVGGDGDDTLTGGPLKPAMYRVAVGGTSILATDGGPDWSPDTSADPSEYLLAGNSQVTVPTATIRYDASDVENVPQDLFERLRTDATSMTWQFPVFESANYTVRLYLAEGDQAVGGAGQNVFDVSVESMVPTAFDDIDPWVLGGSGNGGAGNDAFVLSADVVVEDGVLDVVFVPGIGATSVYAIEIIYDTTDDDTLDGGDGNDTVSYVDESGRVAVDLVAGTATQYGNAGSSEADDVVATDSLANLENVIGSAFDDVLTGNEEDNLLASGGGDNTVTGGGGNDTWSTAGGPTAVTIDLTAWSPNGAVDQANSYGGVDTITGFVNAISGAGNDTIIGDGRDNVLSGGPGEDIITGGDGFDTVDYQENGEQGIDVQLWELVDGQRTGKWIDAFGDSDTVDRTTVEAYQGTSADDRMSGDGGGRLSALAQAIFDGEAGDDTLIGSGLDDQLDGGDDDDTLTGLAGNDTLSGGEGDDLLVAAGNQAQLVTEINVGGAAIDGWGEDTEANPSPLLQPGATTIISGNTATVLYDAAAVNDAPPAIFDVARYSEGNMTWEIPLYGAGTYPSTTGGGSYTVNLYIVEGYGGFQAPGDRVFDVSVEGTVPTVFDDIDPWVLGGEGNDGKGNEAFVLSYTTTVTDGAMSLEFISDINNPIIFGIEVIQNATDDDTLDGGDGTDGASYADNAGKVEVDLTAGTAKQYDAAATLTASDSIANVENVTGSAAADSLVGDTENNVLTGFTGDDTIDGGGGFDTADYAQRSSAINALISSADADGTFTMSLFDGDDVGSIVETDTLTAIEMVTGTALNDSIAGSAEPDTFGGGDGNDFLIGNGGADTLEGGDGNDTLIGGANPILYRVNNGDNGVVPANDGGPDWSLDEQNDRSPYLSNAPETTYANGVKLYYVASAVDGAPEALFQWYRDYGVGTADWNFPVPVAGYYAFSVYSTEVIPQNVADDSTYFNVVFEGTKPPQFTPVNPWQLSGGDNGGLGHGVVKVTADALVTDGTATAGIVTIVNQGDDGVAATNAVQLIGYNIGDDSADKLLGGDGNDTLMGYDGSDVLDGGTGIDTASYLYNHGKVVVDLANGMAQEYGVSGTSEANTVVSTDSLTDIEQVVGSAFDDSLTGDANDNVLEGGAGADTLNGKAGTDLFVGSASDMAGDTVADLEDRETIQIRDSLGDVAFVSESVGETRFFVDADGDGTFDASFLVSGDVSSLELDRLSVERSLDGRDLLVSLSPAYSSVRVDDGGDGTSGDDLLYGSSEADRLKGLGGDDVVDGNAGDDQLSGGSGDDVIRGEDGNDTIGGGSSDDWASGGRGDDDLTGGSGDDRLDGGDGDDTVEGGSGDDVVLGGNDNDTLFGGSGNDVLGMGAGRSNTATGGSGGDVFLFGIELANGTRESHRITDYEAGADAIDLGGFGIDLTQETSRSVLLWVGPDRDMIEVEGVSDATLLTFVEDTLL